MKRFFILYLVIFSFIFLQCERKMLYNPTAQERAKVDSTVYLHRNIDSLSILYDRYKKEENLYGRVVVCRELGRAFRNSSRYREAIEIHTEGLDIAKEICDTLQIIQAFNNLGTVYRRLGKLEEASYWHYQGLLMCERWSKGETTSVGLKNKVVSLNGLGNVLLSLGKDSLAMRSFREALKGESQLGCITGMAINYANIGTIFEKGGFGDSAAFYYGQSLKCNTQVGSDLGVALCHNHFGRLAEKEKEYGKSYREYKLAYDILSEGDDNWHWLESCISLSRISFLNKDHAQAVEYLNRALDVAEELASDSHLAEIYRLCYAIDKNDGKYGEAIKWMEQYINVQKRLYDEKSKDAIYEIRAEYEREKSLAQMRMMQKEHAAKLYRDKWLIEGIVVFLVLSLVAIVLLVYSLRLRSRNSKILKELDKTKNSYFTNIAHEFRTPLTVIKSAANQLRNSADNEGARTDASDIITHSDSLLNLVNQILGIAKMESSVAAEPVWRSGNLSAFIYGICERIARLAQENGVELKYEIEEDLYMDFVPDYVIQVVQNLLSNAIKFSGKGGTVNLSLCKVVSDGGAECARITVKDWGTGISKEDMERLFEPFYQADNAKFHIGTGVGLALVKLSVEAMNGSVKVKSSPEEGTEFIVEIPIVHKAIEEIDINSDSDDFCILIVEDNYDVAKWQMRQLGGGNYRLIYAENGKEGLQKAEESIPDIIITDVMMPVMDGLDLCRRVRESELLCHIPVIMVTAKATYEDRMMGLEAGADVYLEKPYDQKELVLRVSTLLRRREALRRYFTGAVSPEEDAGMPQFSVADSAFIEKFDIALNAAFEKGKVDCEDIAAALCIGREHLNRKMKAITGLKTTEYILQARIAKAKELLCSTNLSIGEIALRCGIEDIGYFSTVFKKHAGMTPSGYRNRCHNIST